MSEQLYNVNVASSELLPTPEDVKRELPASPDAQRCVLNARSVIREILDRRDPRLFVVVGPCSIHDLDAAREYARRLKTLADQLEAGGRKAHVIGGAKLAAELDAKRAIDEGARLAASF